MNPTAPAMSSHAAGPSRLADNRRLVLIALSYALAQLVALVFPALQDVTHAIRPAGGVALTALLLSPRRQRWSILAVLLVSGQVAHLLMGHAVLASTGFTVADALNAWGCAWLFNRWCGDTVVTFGRLREVLTLVVGGTAVNGVTTLLSAAAATAGTHHSFSATYFATLVAECLGILLVTPALVVSAQPWQRFAANRRTRLLEAAALCLLWLGCVGFGFLGTNVDLPVVPRPYWVFAPLVWAALRFHIRGTVVLLALFGALAVWLTANGHGDIPLGGRNAVERMQMVQLFLGLVAVTGLILAATVAERRRAEANLRTALARLHEAQEMGNMGSFVHHIGEHRISSSPQLQQILGLDPAHAESPEVWRGLPHPDDRAAVLAASLACIMEGKPLDLKYRILRHSDGQMRWIRAIARAEKDPTGKIIRFAGVNIDITEDHLLKQTLADTAAQFARTGALAKIGGWELDLRTGHRFWSVETCRLLELDPPVTPTSSEHVLLSFYAPEVRASVQAALQNALEQGTDFDIEVPMVTAKGRHIWVRDQGAVERSAGKAVRIVGVLQDVTERVRLERAVRHSEARLAATLSAINDLIFVFDHEGRFLEAHYPAATNLLDKPANFVGKTYAEVLPPAVAGQITTALRALARTGEVQHFDYELTIEGKMSWWSASLSRRADPDRPELGAVVVVRDITERRRSAEALRASEEKYRGIFDEAISAIYIFDLAKRFIDSNQAGLDLLGYSRGELLRLSIPDVDANPVVVLTAHQQLQSGGRLINFEHQLRRKDGTIITVLNNSRPLTDQGGNTVGMLSTLLDITELKRVEAQKHAMQLQLLWAMDQAHLAHWEFDAATATYTFNDRFYALYGTTAAREGGYRLSQEIYLREFLLAEDHAPVLNRYAGLLAGQVDDQGWEIRVRRRDGQLRHMLVQVSPVRNAAGRITGARGANQDVTDRIVQQRKLQELLAQTERDAHTKGELLREVNHRVTNNLASILGLFVGEQKFIEPTARPLVQPVLDRLTQRIRGLLTAHRMLSSAAWAPVRVDKLAEKLISAALSAYPSPHPAQVDIPPSPVEVSPRQAGSLALILNELTTNSIKHGRRPDRPLALRVEAGTDGDFVTLCFRDNGPGFPSEIIAGARGNIGQQLIRQLVTESLQGDFTLANDAGAVVRLRLRIEEPHRT